MNYELRSQSIAQGKCDDCNHESICKYVQKKREVEAKLAEIKTEFGCPVKTQCTCDNFEKKLRKQDGFMGSRGLK